MARHSNGKDNYKIAGWVIAVAIAVVVAIIALVIFLLSRGGDDVDNAADSAITSEAPAETQEDDAATERTYEEVTSEEDEAAAEATSEAPETSEAETPSEEPAAPSAAASDTLILLDTSDGLAGQFESVTGALANTARALAADGQSVALWNYSSPLNPGVTVGFRNNLGFGSGEDAANTITAFGTGGAPQSRSAVVAAVDTATDQAANTNAPVRVLLVTTGTDADMDDASFAQAYGQAAGDNVELSVVHVGPGEPDSAIEGVASSFTAVDVNDSTAVADALKAAAGA
ncbi:MAG: VWA domain-containing protein [Corynebacterium casei]|nr:VWA domain-containing protein [Corynebacterium casei]